MYVHKKSLKTEFKTVFRYTMNNHLNLCGQVQISKWILCSPKTGIKCGHLSFLSQHF